MNIVVVEDEVPIREGLVKLLQKNPLDTVVGTAENGLQGLKLIREVQPDLVIMDIHMPDLDGLTMLKILRKEQNTCKAIVLTAYSDFNYAQEAITLEIENYLLKPIKIPELKKALEIVRTKLDQEINVEKLMPLETILLGSLTGQLNVDEQLAKIMEQHYGLSEHEEIGILMLWLGESFQEQKFRVKKIFREKLDSAFKYHMLELPSFLSVFVMFYNIPREHTIYKYLQRNMMPILSQEIDGQLICVWKRADNLMTMQDTIKSMNNAMEWNLTFGRGVLIGNEGFLNLNLTPLEYPAEIESQGRKAVMNRSRLECEKCFQRFVKYCRGEVHAPKDMKDACLQYCWMVLNTSKEKGKVGKEVSAQTLLSVITSAIEWDEITKILQEIFEYMIEEKPADTPTGELVQQARILIEERYNQGLTLQELAELLHVSDEYLSTVIKKETGHTFSETIRKYRIRKAQELLSHTNMKLNQIAEMCGYADPKYMSKVFKEEVGMLPNDYRKLNS